MTVNAYPIPRGIFTLVTLIALITIIAAQVCVAQSERNGEDDAPRTLELFEVGYKLPIEIVAIRNLRSKHWMRDLELEIRNVSAKPVYEVYIGLLLPDDNYITPERFYGIYLQYGPTRLVNPRNRPSADDKPISPGESVVLKVDEKLWMGYEQHIQIHNVPEEASYRVRLIIEDIQFGDGTGFIHGGVPYRGDDKATYRYKRFVKVQPEERAIFSLIRIQRVA